MNLLYWRVNDINQDFFLGGKIYCLTSNGYNGYELTTPTFHGTWGSMGVFGGFSSKPCLSTGRQYYWHRWWFCLSFFHSTHDQTSWDIYFFLWRFTLFFRIFADNTMKSSATVLYLVGGLEHVLCSIIYGNNSPNWLSYFQDGWNHQPGYSFFFLSVASKMTKVEGLAIPGTCLWLATFFEAGKIRLVPSGKLT